MFPKLCRCDEPVVLSSAAECRVCRVRPREKMAGKFRDSKSIKVAHRPTAPGLDRVLTVRDRFRIGLVQGCPTERVRPQAGEIAALCRSRLMQGILHAGIP